jgi:hypothetical protein
MFVNSRLCIDWVRWSLRGHKGFDLTKTEVQNGIDAQQFIRGLEKNANGSWIWTDKPVSSVTAQTASSPVIKDNGITYTIAGLDSLFGVRAVIRTPSHISIEVKKERLELVQLKDAFSRSGSPLAPLPTGAQISDVVPQSNSTIPSQSSSTTATNNIDSTIVPINRPAQNSTSIATIQSAGVDQRQTSTGIKRRRRESAEPIKRHRTALAVKVFHPIVCITLLILLSPDRLERREGRPTGAPTWRDNVQYVFVFS